jgi:GAF domain-containing protein
VLGALTVQSTEANTFNPDVIATLQTLADHIALSLNNAELFAKSEAALKAERRAYGELSHSAWKELSQQQNNPGYLVNADGTIHPIRGQFTFQEAQTAIQSGQIIQDDGMTAIIPIKSRGYVLGGIKIRKDDAAWTPSEIELVKTLSEQLSVALESALLFKQTQQRAAQEKLVGEVTTRIRESLDIETVLKTAAQEVRQALGLPEVVVRLASKPQTTSSQN